MRRRQESMCAIIKGKIYWKSKANSVWLDYWDLAAPDRCGTGRIGKEPENQKLQTCEITGYYMLFEACFGASPLVK